MCARNQILGACIIYLFKLRVLLVRLSFPLRYFPHFYVLSATVLTRWVLFLKCSAICIGFNGAETNCGIARNLGILLMNSWDT